MIFFFIYDYKQKQTFLDYSPGRENRKKHSIPIPIPRPTPGEKSKKGTGRLWWHKCRPSIKENPNSRGEKHATLGFCFSNPGSPGLFCLEAPFMPPMAGTVYRGIQNRAKHCAAASGSGTEASFESLRSIT
jgi:hypothetical protein